MSNYLRFIAVAFICLGLCTCKKQDTRTAPVVRLQKIVMNGVDSVQNVCNSCMYYQFFKYDQAGTLIGINDSSSILWNYQYDGPHPYTLGYNIHQFFQYNAQGSLLKIGSDSFVHNAVNQVVQRFRRLSSDTTKSVLINSYAYDTKGRLVIDSTFTGISISNPFNRIVTYYDMYTYDNNDNMVQVDEAHYYQGNITHHVSTAQYDNGLNPFKNLGFVMYLACRVPFIVSKNNVLLPGYTYEYYNNGYLKKITYQGIVQEFFYE